MLSQWGVQCTCQEQSNVMAERFNWKTQGVKTVERSYRRFKTSDSQFLRLRRLVSLSTKIKDITSHRAGY